MTTAHGMTEFSNPTGVPTGAIGKWESCSATRHHATRPSDETGEDGALLRSRDRDRIATAVGHYQRTEDEEAHAPRVDVVEGAR